MTLFEVGKLPDESLDSLLMELDKVNHYHLMFIVFQLYLVWVHGKIICFSSNKKQIIINSFNQCGMLPVVIVVTA